MNSNIKDVYGLTPAQEGIYVQGVRNNDSKTYHFHALCKINKESDIDLLKKSAELLFLRHQALKSAFVVLKSTGAIKQVILENRQPEFVVVLLEESFSQDVLDKIIDKDAEKTLDLQRDSLIKITLVDFSDERYLLFRSHHIILDGWCFPIIINDLQNYYKALFDGVSVNELSDKIEKEASEQTSYAQYVSWLKKQNKKETAEYWKKTLSGCSFSHIFGKKRKYDEEKDIVTFRIRLRDDIAKRVESFARKSRVSVNAVFESAFSIALQKFSGSEDIVFDKVISGRGVPLKNIENTVGLFVNTVPTRVSSNENSTLSDMLKKTQRQTIDTNTFGTLALSEIYKECDINGDSIDVLFVFENYYNGDLAADIEKGPLSPSFVFFNEQTEFNLAVAIFLENSGYTIRISYARDLYTEAEIDAFVNGYVSILGEYIDGEKLVKDITVTDAGVIDSYNATSHTYDIPEDSTLYSLFENTAKENAEKVCLKADGEEVTFGELLNLSEKLDAELRSITRGEKSVVAVIAERSAEMYAAVYGIIRGGNAYLPIDPDYPQERIDYILENSNAAAVVVQGKFRGKIVGQSCIDMTEFIKNADKKQTDIPESAAKPEDTAYVIYTSGSTGAPKGARVSHKSAVNRILWMHDKYPLEVNDVILQKTPYTFDVSVWEIFWWGMCGGSLAASKPGEHFLPARILEETEKNGVTHIHFVPSVFELFLNYLESHSEECAKFGTVKYVFLSGEALTSNLVQRFYSIFDYNNVSLHNLYGPTECAVDVTYYDCTSSEEDPVPIGKPIYNTQIYVLDKYLNPVPVGVTGELCIAGVNVGQGYLNNPELTAEKFIDNPLGEGMLYRTGDNAYWREDGNIVFCGRKDGQIKLNGQRIEIGEIESVISSVPGVESVAVIVRNFNQRDVLVAFYSGRKLSEEKIKVACREKMPGYMVPSFVVYMNALPLNNNGKLDRKVLEKTEFNTCAPRAQAPVNSAEKKICSIFRKYLSEENIGRDSDFFELGGTSLTMISVLSEDIFEILTAAEFMRNPTPAMLARIMTGKMRDSFEYLEPLYIAENTERVIILLPFAGGGAEAYSEFIKALKKDHSGVSAYFIRYLHSVDECRRAADEIATALAGEEVLFYSHCVGSAVALQIISSLENQGFPVKHYFAGASIPPEKTSNKNIWNYVPDIVLKHILVKAGADFGGLSNDKISLMLKKFRKDTDFSRTGFSELSKKLQTPVSAVMSKDDRFTKNYAQAEKLWRKHFNAISGIHFIGSGIHYFQQSNAAELVEIIFKDA